MRNSLIGLWLAGVVLLAGGVARAQSGPRPPQSEAAGAESPSESEVVLRIDGEEITWGEFARWIVRSLGERQAREFALDYWVVEREAERRHVEVDESTVAARVQRELDERLQHAFFGRKQEWLDELARTGRTEPGVRAQRSLEARVDLLAGALANLDRVVPEHKLVREWELRYGRHGRRYELLMMKFKVEVPAPERFSRDEWLERERAAKAAARKRAEDVRARRLAGEEFAALAARSSDDPDTRTHRGRPSGGFRDPGWPWGFLDALERLPVGQVSEPLFAKGGWWLIEVQAVQETPFDRVRRELELELIAAGPEPDERAAVQSRLKENATYQCLPAMWGERADSERPDLEDPVLSIDGETVSKAVYGRFLCRMRGETLARTFAESWLVHKRARELGLSTSLEEARERAQAYIEGLIGDVKGGSREAWLEYMKQGGRDPEGLLRELTYRSLTDVLAEKLLRAGRKITPEELRGQFVKAYGSDGERVDARMILLPIRLETIEEGWSREELDRRLAEAAARIEERARGLKERVQSGEDFAALARRESEDKRTAASGGWVGERFRPDHWSEEIFAAVSAGREGECVGPLRQGMAWFLFQVLAHRKVAFEDVARELETELLEQRPSLPDLASFRNSLLQGVKLEILPALSR